MFLVDVERYLFSWHVLVFSKKRFIQGMRYSFPLQSWSTFLFPNKITELVMLYHSQKSVEFK